MATFQLTSSPSFTISKSRNQTIPQPALPLRFYPPSSRTLSRSNLSRIVVARSSSYKVLIEHEGQTTELQVESDETILSKALDSGLDVPHDCKLGVCMTCPARLINGIVDQSDGMLSDDVVDKGYALLCASYPRSDCHIKTIPEEELLSMQLATAND